MQFKSFSIDGFLRDFWQKRPLLIRNPWKNWVNPLDPDELAGLACEEGIESRLITGPAGQVTVESGPFPENRFSDLGAHLWTLLVQAVDHHSPDVAALIEPFRFIPNWRIDDVMVSYATDGGGVGPHYDQYDVFLIQGLGRRRWRTGPRCDAATPLLPHDDLRLIAEFEPDQEWLLEPGDILYVPPGFAHDGVAVGDDCMTYSVGFRAPSRADLVEGWSAHQADIMLEEDRYADPGLTRQSNPGEISPAALDRMHSMVMEALGDRDAFARWFGLHNSLPKYADADWRPDEPIAPDEVHALLAQGSLLRRNPASRCAFIGQGPSLLLFVDGHCFECGEDTAPFAEELCSASTLAPTPHLAQVTGAITLIKTLIDQGSLAFDEED